MSHRFFRQWHSLHTPSPQLYDWHAQLKEKIQLDVTKNSVDGREKRTDKREKGAEARTFWMRTILFPLLLSTAHQAPDLPYHCNALDCSINTFISIDANGSFPSLKYYNGEFFMSYTRSGTSLMMARCTRTSCTVVGPLASKGVGYARVLKDLNSMTFEPIPAPY